MILRPFLKRYSIQVTGASLIYQVQKRLSFTIQVRSEGCYLTKALSMLVDQKSFFTTGQRR